VSRGWVEINGIAWSEYGRILGVDVSTYAGRTWTPARLQGPVLPKAQTRIRHLWNWTGSETVIMSRAIDEAGYVGGRWLACAASKSQHARGGLGRQTNLI
jgi:sulfane dehydrogenase subunit SoxC